jgi:lipopolysaccharide heptosyltransferase I
LAAKKILLIRLSSIGDVLHCTPIAQTLREQFPDAKISWVVGEKSKDILLGNPYLDQIIVWQREKWEAALRTGAWRSGYHDFRNLERYLKEDRYDIAIDMHGLLLTGLIAWRSGAKTRIGFSNAREGSPLFYTEKVKPLVGQQITRQYLQLLKALDVRKVSNTMLMPIAEENLKFAEHIWEQHHIGADDIVVILNPSTSWVTKNWPPEHFTMLANLLISKHRAKIMLLGAHGDIPLVNKIASGITDEIINLAGKTNLKDLAAVVKKSNLFIGGDTGPLHIAAAVGTPTISLFGPTNPRIYAPEGPGHIALTAPVNCKGCHSRTCQDIVCMKQILPLEVYQAARGLLAQSVRKRKHMEAIIYGQVPVKTIYSSV